MNYWVDDGAFTGMRNVEEFGVEEAEFNSVTARIYIYITGREVSETMITLTTVDVL